MKVLAIVPYSKNSFQFAHRQIAALRKNDINVEVFFLRNRMNPFALVIEYLEMRKLIRNFKPDLIHAHYGSVTSFFGCLNFDLPVVITFRGSDINVNPSLSFFRMKLVHFLSRASSHFARHIFCVSEEIANKLPCVRSKVSVLPSGVEDQEFQPMSQEEVRKKIQLNTQDKIILFNAGRNPTLKRLDLAERLHQELLREIPNLKLIVLDGMTASNEIPYYINSADLIILTSESEGSPNIVKEAASCGVPVVSFDVGDVRHILSESSVSRVISDRNFAEMVQAAGQILNNSSSKRTSYLPERYRASFITSEIIKVYNQIATEL